MLARAGMAWAERDTLVLDALKTGLVLVAAIGTLFDLDHLDFLKHRKSVPAGREQDDVARAKNPALQIDSVVVVKIDPEFALSQEQDFLRVEDLARHQIMRMWFYLLSCPVAHIGELLRELRRRQEVYTASPRALSKDQGEWFPLTLHDLHGGRGRDLRRLWTKRPRLSASKHGGSPPLE